MSIEIESKPFYPSEMPGKSYNIYEEVWDGVTVMRPMENVEHMYVMGEIHDCLRDIIDRQAGDIVVQTVNVSDRNHGWLKNYRIPEITLVLASGYAINHGTHFEGGPDFLVEIVSPSEAPHAKLPFYETTGTREVVIVHRDPWKLELFQLNTQQKLELAGESDITSSQVITSSVLPLSFQLVQATSRPVIVMTHTQTQQRWEA